MILLPHCGNRVKRKKYEPQRLSVESLSDQGVAVQFEAKYKQTKIKVAALDWLDIKQYLCRMFLDRERILKDYKFNVLDEKLSIKD